MKKHASQEAFYQRLRTLAETQKTTVKESIRNLGSLIDYKRAADGVAYGIIKENHHYYIKKAGTKQDPNVADFAYIGGLSNITNYQYKSLAEADKHRNMIFHTINEAVSIKPDKNGSRKKMLTEDKAGEEIEQASEKASALDAASSEAQPEVPAEPAAPIAGEVPAEPAGDEAPVDAAPEVPAGDVPAEPAGAEPEIPTGDETPEVPAGDEEATEEPAGDEPAPDGEETKDEISSEIGKIGEKVQNKSLQPDKVKEYVGMFLGYFTDYFKNMEQNDLDELGKKITEVNKESNVEDLEASTPSEPVTAQGDVEEAQCSECGSFGMYAESRGYGSPEAFMECDSEEQANVVADYVTAHNDGMNDGDEKTISLIIKLSPEVLDKLKNDYGHEDYTNKIQPSIDSMNEASEEDTMLQLKEGWNDFKQGLKQVGSAIGGAAKQAATGVKQAYHGMGVNPAFNKLAQIATDLGKQINAANQKAQKAGQNPVKVQDIMNVITKQLTTPDAVGKQGQALTGAAADAWRLGKTGQSTAGTNVSGKQLRYAAESVDPAAVETKPEMLKEEEDEEEKSFDVNDLNVDDEKKGEDIDIEAGEEKEEKPAIDFAPAGQTLGAGVAKPEGAGVSVEVTPDKTVRIEMSESEKKLRKYIRERLQVKAGVIKESINESKKSPKLKKLDEMIDKQFDLYKTAIKK